MSDNAATPQLPTTEHECDGSGSCPVHHPDATPEPRALEANELRDLVARAMVGLSARPLSIVTGHLTHDQVMAACRALDVDPGPVVQLSIVAFRGGAQLVVWAHE